MGKKLKKEESSKEINEESTEDFIKKMKEKLAKYASNLKEEKNKQNK